MFLSGFFGFLVLFGYLAVIGYLLFLATRFVQAFERIASAFERRERDR